MNDDERATRILREHHRSLERVIASYARVEADRADLRQDVALALWSALPTFRGECSEQTFLLRIAHNRALTFVTRRGGPRERMEEIEAHEGRATATSGKNPAIVYERRENASRMLAAVRALPVGHRQVITLLLEGLSHREIAGVLGVTENVVAVRANRARNALRVLLSEEKEVQG